MKVVFAPDSFKGALRSPSVAAALARGWRMRRPLDELTELPLADGGEGTADALVAGLRGKTLQVAAHDPFMRPITACVGTTSDLAIIETAEANGLELLNRSELDPRRASSYGAGELLNFLLTRGFRKILIGIGGSATVDGGIGMLQALGVEFFDAAGHKFPPGAGGGCLANVAAFDLGGLRKKLDGVSLYVACDVTNVLLGDTGAAKVFGPQKGADAATVELLERGLARWSEIWQCSGDTPGDGAAGGLGYMLRRVLAAEIASGADLVMDMCGFDAAAGNASLVVTGEGCSDEQTACGKLCYAVAARAAAAGTPTVLCSGALKGDVSVLEQCFSSVFSISNGPETLESAIAGTEQNLIRAGAALAGMVTAFNLQ